ncbi:MAG TPA: APC family permease [Steroidobacteraceae bacterium]|nr:APC family permease [Steroidobacteraceae bacterium]
MSAAETSSPALLRAVSRWQLVGLAVNDVVGSGIYLLPAAAAALLGGASVWAIVLAGVAAALLVLCFAEASSYFDQPGGAYLYTREAFGRFIGFEVGWMTWLSRVAAMASFANGLVQATTYFWPAAAGGWARAGIICALIVPLAGINIWGVGAGARTAVVLVIAKMLPLAFFVAVGAWFIDGSHLLIFAAPRTGALGQAALLLLFAYGGFENTPVAAGEYHNPRRNVPFALLAMILVVTLLYGAVQVVALGTLPGLARSSSPLAEAAQRFAGHPGAWLLTLGAMLSIIGIAGNTMLSGPRYLFALASDGYGPRWLAQVHAGYRTPAAAIGVQAVSVLVLAMSGSFVQLASLSVIARVATYIGTAAAVPILRRRMADRAAVRLPLGPAIPIAALLVAAVLLGSATGTNLLSTLGALAAGGVIFLLRRPQAGEQRPSRQALKR